MHALFEMEGKLDLRIEIKEGCYCLQFGDGRTGDMNHFLQKWYDARTELEEKLLGLTDEERKREILTYNLYEWNFNGKSN